MPLSPLFPGGLLKDHDNLVITGYLYLEYLGGRAPYAPYPGEGHLFGPHGAFVGGLLKDHDHLVFKGHLYLEYLGGCAP